jgi:predicted Rossmann fold flavoprotein
MTEFENLTDFSGGRDATPPPYDVIVVGAGAAGILAAGRAAELGSKVLLLEKMDRAGRKLLLTGKGRCNITNTAPLDEFLKHIHPNSRFIRHAFSRFFSDDITRLLNENGCLTVIERGGRVFPSSNRSSDVLNSLMQWMTRHPVEIRYRHKVTDLVLQDGRVAGLKIHSTRGHEMIRAKSVILCTGGMAYPATGSNGDGYSLAASAGHTIETPRPALVPLETAGDMAPRLQGLNLKNVRAAVWIHGKKTQDAFGEMLFTEFGISGPIILTLSRLMVDALRNNARVELSIDLKPALDETKLDLRLVRDLTAN